MTSNKNVPKHHKEMSRGSPGWCQAGVLCTFAI